MDYSARNILQSLLLLTPRRTADAPKDARGIYGLIDHCGDLRYIGSTSSIGQSLYERIHNRHRTGSEGMSHYFSNMYNVGRMWRDRLDPTTKLDGKRAKDLRSAFIEDHCGAIWIAIPDHVDIADLESQVLSIAPAGAIAWNGRSTAVYDEPADLVELTIARLGWGADYIAAVERQRQRHFGNSLPPSGLSPKLSTTAADLPSGEFRFFALDVETANNDRSSICQIGVACVRPDNTIETWVTYVDPKTEVWTCSAIHGITAKKVRGAPTFDQVLPLLESALTGRTVYQHSAFDQSAMSAACLRQGLMLPTWTWKDSVQVARAAWPELKGNGGHGLASLKRYLGLNFRHHDAGEDARASAEIVLLAKILPGDQAPISDREIERLPGTSGPQRDLGATLAPVVGQSTDGAVRRLGTSEIRQGNINNHHIYLRGFFDKFPLEVVGGSNIGSAASREILVEWGGTVPVLTDLDGEKKFFRKRAWIKQFFEQNSVVAGSAASIDQIGHLRYRVSVHSR